MSVTTTRTNKPIIPRGQDASPLKYNRAALYSGKALDFDGVNDNVAVPNLSILSTSDFTICYAAKFESSGDNWAVSQGTTGTNNAIITGRQSGNVIRFAFFGNDLDAPTNQTPSLNEWCWLVFTYNRTTKERKIYINGVLAAEDISAANPNPVGSDFQVSSYSAVGGYYNNQVSNVKVYSTALTAAQVADLYNNPEKIVPTGVSNTALKLWLPMMEGAGTTAYDGSGNGNHGTISGATYVNGVGAPVAQSAVIDWNKASNIVQNTDISDSYWSAGSQVTRTGDQESVSGLYNSATLIEDTTTNAAHWAGAAVTTSASTTYIQAAFLKKKDSGIYASLRTNGAGPNSFVVFDFDTATIVGVGSDIDDYGVVPFANGWYRVWMKYTLAPSGIIVGVSNSTSEPIPSYAGTGIGFYADFPTLEVADEIGPALTTTGTAQTTPVLLPQGLTTGRDITGVNLFENVRKQGALNLDGNSWAEVHDNGSLDFGTGSFTLEAWAKAKYTSGGSIYNVIMILGGNASTAPNAAILVDNSVRPQAMYNNQASVTPAQNTGDWYHIVAAYDETDMFVFINGAQVLQNGRTAVDITNTLVKYIGRDSSTQRYYSDQIAQPRIYNRALTAEEVQRNYDAGKNIYTNS